jgi:hypothetical protein
VKFPRATRLSGMKAARARSAASAWNVGRRRPILPHSVQEWAGWARGSTSSGRIREALSTVAAPLADRLVVVVKLL